MSIAAAAVAAATTNLGKTLAPVRQLLPVARHSWPTARFSLLSPSLWIVQSVRAKASRHARQMPPQHYLRAARRPSASRMLLAAAEDDLQSDPCTDRVCLSVSTAC